MKRVSYEAGWGELRGNVSGSQKLQYPTNNQGAYESVPGQKNYASNYKPRVIVSKRSATGLLYFSIRKKTANHLTNKSKKAMALLGGAGALYAALLKTPAKLTTAQSLWEYAQAHGDIRSFRAYMMDFFRQGLINHVAAFTAHVASISLSIDNPWGKLEGSLDISISNAVRIKFWTQLVNNGIEFTVDGMKGIAERGGTWGAMVESSNYNVLNIAIDETTDYARLGGATGAYIVDGSLYQATDADIEAKAYTTTDVDPE